MAARARQPLGVDGVGSVDLEQSARPVRHEADVQLVDGPGGRVGCQAGLRTEEALAHSRLPVSPSTRVGRKQSASVLPGSGLLQRRCRPCPARVLATRFGRGPQVRHLAPEVLHLASQVLLDPAGWREGAWLGHPVEEIGQDPLPGFGAAGCQRRQGQAEAHGQAPPPLRLAAAAAHLMWHFRQRYSVLTPPR